MAPPTEDTLRHKMLQHMAASPDAEFKVLWPELRKDPSFQNVALGTGLKTFLAVLKETEESGLSIAELLKRQRELPENVQAPCPIKASPYRFDIGAKVLCRIGADKWAAGEIVELSYIEPGWRKTVPYKVRLDDGVSIYVPADLEKICRKLELPWWSKIFAGKPDGYFSSNPSAELLSRELENTRKLHRGQIHQGHVNAADHLGQVALMLAAQYNWHSGVSELLRLKADVNVVTKTNKHALHFAAAHGEDITKILIEANADLNIQEDDQDFDPKFTSATFGNRKQHRSPLHMATLMGHAATATLLISRGAQIDLRDAQYKTALHLAYEEEDTEIIDLLLHQKADVNLGNTEFGMNSSLLMEAAYRRDITIVKKLVEAKAVINQQGKQSMSALHLAARNGDTEIVQALIEGKADINQKSQCGTAEDLARKNGGISLLKLLGLSEKSGCSKPRSVMEMDSAQRAALFMD